MPSATAPVTWPTASELEQVANVLGGAWEQVDLLRERMGRLVDLDVGPSTEEAVMNGAGPLTAKVVGDLSGCLARVRFDLEEILKDVETIETMRDTMALEMVFDDA